MVYFIVVILISGGLIGYWYFFDRSPVEQPQPTTDFSDHFEAYNWDQFHNELMLMGHEKFFGQIPIEQFAYILGIDVLGMNLNYNNEEGFGNLTNDLVNRFNEDKTLFTFFNDEMISSNMDVNLTMLDTYNHYSGMDDHSFSDQSSHDFHNNDF